MFYNVVSFFTIHFT
ncbi:hypothetical protein CACET_c11010 [Clostridium aceticum]|uniref:Uncharacterized protein n=1 Tax=Clostridium aceticum TaxID=84022 RepID=A0A0G3W9P8_9CLOT|nr:hypothetical protein CACET_c11010 [Clostridium aceticum]